MSLDFTIFKEVNVGRKDTVYTPYFTANCTHNLAEMAKLAGIYKQLWRPDELNITHAGMLIPALEDALVDMRKNEMKYQKLNPENGWGDYEGFLEFVSEVSNACIKFPKCQVEVCR